MKDYGIIGSMALVGQCASCGDYKEYAHHQHFAYGYIAIRCNECENY